MGLEVNVFCVKDGKYSTGKRDDAVGNQFDRLEGASFGTDISGVDNVIDPNGDLHAGLFLLVGFEFSDNLGVCELFAEVRGDIPVTYDAEGVSYFGTLQ